MAEQGLLDGIVLYCDQRTTTSVRDLIHHFPNVQPYQVQDEAVRAIEELYLNGYVIRTQLMDGNTRANVRHFRGITDKGRHLLSRGASGREKTW